MSVNVTLSLFRRGGGVLMRRDIFIGYRVPVLDQNSARWIATRHTTVSGGDVNSCINIAYCVSKVTIVVVQSTR